MRARAQRVVATLTMAGLVAAGAWALRRPPPGQATRCPQPAAIQQGGRTLIICGVPLAGAPLGRLQQQLGLDLESCPTAEQQRVRPGELLRLQPRCEHVLTRMPAAQGLLLGIKLELNQATAKELEALPRIGPKLAQRVVELRRRRGTFRRVEELQQVKGIGPRTMALLRPLVRVGP